METAAIILASWLYWASETLYLLLWGHSDQSLEAFNMSPNEENNAIA
jgi:hypothetical protein